MIEGPRAIRLYVTNLELAEEWYSRALEATPNFHDENSATFVVGGCQFTLELTDISGHPLTRVYWGVDDLSWEYKRLCSIGQSEGKTAELIDANSRTAEVLDPFGNVFGLFANNGKNERAARIRRVEQKLALQNVRETLDQIQQKEADQKKIDRAVGWFAAIALVLMFGIIGTLVSSRKSSSVQQLTLPISTQSK
jgi:predicted enzyme related to lactoylglutathione lyase